MDIDREYPVRVYRLVGEVTLSIDEHRGTRDTPGAVKIKATHYDLVLTSFNEDGFEQQLEIDEEWKAVAEQEAISLL